MHGTLSDQSLIYLQIAQMLEDDILRGVYREEEQVPPPMSSPGSITSTGHGGQRAQPPLGGGDPV